MCSSECGFGFIEAIIARLLSVNLLPQRLQFVQDFIELNKQQDHNDQRNNQKSGEVGLRNHCLIICLYSRAYHSAVRKTDMDTEDRLLFSELLHAYKRLWVKSRTAKYVAKNPDADPEEVRQEFLEEASRVFAPLNEALLGPQPLLVELRRLIQEIEFLQVD